MKRTVIDIGSNSVRLMLWENCKTIYKMLEVTRLSSGMTGGMLSDESMDRTTLAVRKFYDYSVNELGATPSIFATEAVRSAKNADVFLSKLSLPLDVLSGDEEAKAGFLGACAGEEFQDKTCLVIDIGGASTELTVGRGSDLLFAKSVGIGAIRIFDRCGADREKILKFVKTAINEYGEIPHFERAIVIGGTALNLAAAVNKIIPYEPKKVDKSRVDIEDLKELTDKLFASSIQKRVELGIDEKRADVITGGASLLVEIMKKFNISSCFASESDNLEGYLKLKGYN